MKVFVCLLCASAINALDFDTGSPTGFLSECSGMNRTTTISEKTMKTLYVVVLSTTSSNNGQRCQLSESGAKCVSKLINLKKPLQVLVSGYLESSSSPTVRMFATAYLAHGRNVIILETFPVLLRNYIVAARLSQPLGKALGSFLVALSSHGLSPDDIELIGGSLGAHIASFAADHYANLTGNRLARLTGLDPAGPCFRKVPETKRMHANAAQRVDALHTNIDGFGLADRVAQVDFYANGGEYQPGPVINGLFIPCLIICSHYRSAFYWLTSMIYSNKFVGELCSSMAHIRRGDCYEENNATNILGLNTNFSVQGIFYLPTNPVYPYYKGQEGIKEKSLSYLSNVAPDRDLII